LEKLKTYSYEYKDKMYGKKRHYGVMAQDLEKDPVGKSMVMNTPKGKMVHSGLGFGAVLAAAKNLHDRLKAIETVKGRDGVYRPA
jgi:hypothetical protein